MISQGNNLLIRNREVYPIASGVGANMGRRSRRLQQCKLLGQGGWSPWNRLFCTSDGVNSGYSLQDAAQHSPSGAETRGCKHRSHGTIRRRVDPFHCVKSRLRIPCLHRYERTSRCLPSAIPSGPYTCLSCGLDPDPAATSVAVT